VTPTTGSWPSGAGTFSFSIGGVVYLATNVSGSGPLTITLSSIEDGTDTNAATGTAVAIVTTIRSVKQTISDSINAAVPYQKWIQPFTSTSGWAWINRGTIIAQQGASATLVDEELCFTQPGGTSLLSFYSKSAPSTPYKFLFGMRYDTAQVDYSFYGVGFYDSTSGNVLEIGYARDSGNGGLLVRVIQLTPNGDGATAQLFNTIVTLLMQPVWWALENDGTNLKLYYGASPGQLRLIYTQAVGSFLTPDSIGFSCSKNNSGSGGGGGGVNPTTQTDVTASRSLGTVFQNTTGYPIWVSVTASQVKGHLLQCLTDSANPPTTLVAENFSEPIYGVASVSFIVLPNNFYRVMYDVGGGTLGLWLEWSGGGGSATGQINSGSDYSSCFSMKQV
jgi:hypothetical protein